VAAAFCLLEVEEADAGDAAFSRPIAARKITVILKTNITFPRLNTLPLNPISTVYNLSSKNSCNQST
jgi:hypothetical protein